LHFLFAGKSAKIVMAEGSLIAVDRQHNDGKNVMLNSTPKTGTLPQDQKILTS
jgi:hypothetical protein